MSVSFFSLERERERPPNRGSRDELHEVYNSCREPGQNIYAYSSKELRRPVGVSFVPGNEGRRPAAASLSLRRPIDNRWRHQATAPRFCNGPGSDKCSQPLYVGWLVRASRAFIIGRLDFGKGVVVAWWINIVPAAFPGSVCVVCRQCAYYLNVKSSRCDCIRFHNIVCLCFTLKSCMGTRNGEHGSPRREHKSLRITF